MKTLSLIAVLAAASPAPGAAPQPMQQATVAADTTTSQFEVNGLKVILRRNTATDVVAANLYFLGGSRQLTPQTQGIEALLFAASERGSRKFPGPRLRQEIARVGSVINISLNEDWTTYSLHAI